MELTTARSPPIWMALKGGWINSWRQRLSMAMSPDGCVLSPVFEAVGLGAPVAGEHGWEGAVASCPACSSLADSWLATVWAECWTRWTLGLIQLGTSYVLIILCVCIFLHLSPSPCLFVLNFANNNNNNALFLTRLSTWIEAGNSKYKTQISDLKHCIHY